MLLPWDYSPYRIKHVVLYSFYCRQELAVFNNETQEQCNIAAALHDASISIASIESYQTFIQLMR